MAGSQQVSRVAAAVAAAVAVLLWRILAYRQPSSMIEQAPGFEVPLAIVGMGFVVAGLTLYLARPHPPAGLYLVWCLGAGVHWGGAVGSDAAGVELPLLLLYIGLSAAGEAALLHLALSYPTAWNTPRWLLRLLYLPALVSLVVAPLAGSLPGGALQLAVGLPMLAAGILGIAAGLVFIIRLVGADRRTRRRSRLGLVVVCLLVGGVPSMLAGFGLLPGPGDAYNLLSVVIPVGLGYALWRRVGDESRSSEAFTGGAT